MDCNILITGSEGQLGSILNIELSKIFQVIPTSRNRVHNSSFVSLNIENSNEVKKCIEKYNPRIVINTAAITDVDHCEENKSIARRVNVCGLEHLINYTSKKTKIIHISSDYVFNGSKSLYFEDSKPDPVNYYGKTKLEADNSLIGSNKDYAIIRPNTVYNYNKNNFFTWVYSKISNNKPINVVDDQISNPSYVPSLVKSIIDIIILNGKGLYNHGSKDSLSRYKFALEIAEKFKLNSELIIKCDTSSLNQKAQRPMNSILDIKKIEEHFDSDMFYVNNCLNNIYEIFKNG